MVIYGNLKSLILIATWFFIWINTRKKAIEIPPIKNLDKQLPLTMFLIIWILLGNFIIFYSFYVKEIQIFKNIDFIINIILMTPFILLFTLLSKESFLSIGLSLKQAIGIPVYISVIFIVLLDIVMSKIGIVKFDFWELKYFLINVIWGNAITEELLFRGFIQSRLEAKLGTNKGFILAVLIFAFAHLPKAVFVRYHHSGNFPIYYFLTIIFHSFIWCDIYRRTRNISSLILLHLINNITPLCMRK